ncbi:MAG: ABC transporter ATP-binding protein [Candidatus Hecatellales archaeon]|nr:MAG: ABC transporter ATP-binding protein [Candidatus Hecatellales archaeon]
MPFKVEVSNLHKSFNGFKVIEKLSFNVEQGEFLCLVGPSRCGKTTLLRIILGLETPDSGKILVDGKPVNLEKHRIGYVPQDPTLLPWLSVYDNIALGLRIRGFPREEIKKQVEELMRLIKIEGFRDYYPHQLSGGMKAYVSIARALAINPDIILMDEPFVNLDAQTRNLLQAELIKLHEYAAKTIIFVTHNIEEAVFLADRILVLTKRPARIKRNISMDMPRPRNRYSEEFIKIRESIEELIKEEFEVEFKA